MWRKFSIILYFLILPFFLYSQDIPQGKIAFLYLENVSGRGGEELGKKIYSHIVENFKKQSDYNLVTVENINKILKEKKLENVLEYISLFDIQDILKIGKILNLDKVLLGNILNYQEISTKEKSSVFLKVRIQIVDVNEKDLNNFFEISVNSEIRGKKKIDAARKEAYDNLFEKILRKLQGEEIKEESREYVGNIKSLLVHSPSAKHLPEENERIYFKSLKEAEDAGYKICPICFPELLSSTESADRLEISLAQEICGAIEYYYRILPDTEKINYLNKVGNKILKVTERQNLRYIFTILDTDEINAFAAGAGYIYITKGLLDIVETEDELAGVLAHEIAHIVKKHIVSQYERNTNLSILATAAVIFSGGGTQSNLIADFAQFLIMRGYDRKYEREADQVALSYLIKANYNPYSYITILKKLQELEKVQPSKIEIYFNTHPPVSERIKRAEEFLKNWKEIQKKIKEVTG